MFPRRSNGVLIEGQGPLSAVRISAGHPREVSNLFLAPAGLTAEPDPPLRERPLGVLDRPAAAAPAARPIDSPPATAAAVAVELLKNSRRDPFKVARNLLGCGMTGSL